MLLYSIRDGARATHILSTIKLTLYRQMNCWKKKSTYWFLIFIVVPAFW
jgi:hypothetical protein